MAESTPLLLAVAGLLVLTTAILLWLGYQATSAQERSDRLLAERRARETLALLVAALDRDMKGAQLSVLLQLGPNHLTDISAADLASQASTAFGRFPYIETIFVWHEQAAGHDMPYVLNRADRPPAWDTGARHAAAYPVVTRHGHPVLKDLVRRIRSEAPFEKRFATYELPLGGVRYQVVLHLLYDTIGHQPGLVGIVGYTVNLDWVRAHYFDEIVTQVSAIAGEGQSTVLSIADASDRVIATTVAGAGGGSLTRRFPLAFFDSRLTAMGTSVVTVQTWTASAQPRDGPSDPAATSGQRLFMLMALAALASVAALVIIARAMQARAEVAAMKAEFVSTVTHELKTPLSLMRLVADSLVAGRYRDPEKLPKYGELLSAEVSRMTHLIDNLLSYARLSKVDDRHLAATIDVAELLAAVTADWQPRLAQQGFTLDVAIDNEPMALSGDRTALQQALNNLIDNSTKYSTDDDRRLALRARRQGASIAIEVEDHGMGIHADDIPLVHEKFFRGRGTRAGGSGLGLAIVNRIVKNHGGSVGIRSRQGQGTTVTIVFPAV
jgi:signal transduction histidine kinase